MAANQFAPRQLQQLLGREPLALDHLSKAVATAAWEEAYAFYLLCHFSCNSSMEARHLLLIGLLPGSCNSSIEAIPWLLICLLPGSCNRCLKGSPWLLINYSHAVATAAWEEALVSSLLCPYSCNLGI